MKKVTTNEMRREQKDQKNDSAAKQETSKKLESETPEQNLQHYKEMEKAARKNPTTIIDENIIEKIEINYQRKFTSLKNVTATAVSQNTTKNPLR